MKFAYITAIVQLSVELELGTVNSCTNTFNTYEKFVL